MANRETAEIQIAVKSAQIVAQNVEVTPNILLEEVRLEGGAMRVNCNALGVTDIDLGEVRIRATLSEPNLNQIVQANIPPDMPLKNLQFNLYTGKIKVTGNYVKLISIPVAIDAVILVKNGIDLYLDLTEVKAGMGLPSSVVEVIEGHINRALGHQIGEQIRQLPFPIYIEEIRCEPGRLTVIGRLRVQLNLSTKGDPA